MNNYHTITISSDFSRTAAIKYIKKTLNENSGVILIDLLDVGFPLHRDFFLVLSRKFPKDRYKLLVKTQKIVELAHSLGIEAETAGLQMEFERSYNSENMATHNMGMMEYFLYEMRRGWLWLKFVLFERNKKDPRLPHYKKHNFQMLLIVMGLVSSLVLLIFIFHFAISKSIVTIDPRVTVSPISMNITYRTADVVGSVLETKNILEMKKMEIPMEISEKFSVTAIDPTSAKNARGIITIYNGLTVEQELRPSTRFVTEDGLVYRSEGWAKIPASRSLNGITEIGITEIEVIADTHDESGKLVGERGNISASTTLTIPGLKFNRDKVYAKAKDNFSGGENPKVHILTEEELQSFKNILSEKISKEGRNRVERVLAENLASKGEDFALMIGDTLSVGETSFEIISGHKVGDKVDSIELKATATAYATAMDKKATIQLLTDNFRDNLLRGTNKELAIHPDTLRVSNIVFRSEDGNEIKATLEMNASTIYDFENIHNELTKRLKAIIAGTSKAEAINRLLDDGQIKEAEIQNTPFWIQNVSNNTENIEFVIKK